MSARARRAILRRTKILPSATLNRLAGIALGAWRPRLDEDYIWIVSSLDEPTLAHSSRGQVTTIIDSWDHPVRRTAGYLSDCVIGWNRALGEDWVQFQGAKHVLVGAPLKLKYACDAYPLQPSTDKTLMFAVGTSSHSPAWQDGELQLARKVIRAADLAGWRVLLKVKPTGGQEAWIDLADEFPNVQLSSLQHADGPTNYFLDDEYNRVRLQELQQVRFVLNTVTTFGLDAACAGIPVLQLAGLHGASFAALASAQRNYHLRTHLIGSYDDVLTVSEGTVEDQILGWLRSPDDRAERHAARLRRWLTPTDSFDQAVSAAVGQIL